MQPDVAFVLINCRLLDAFTFHADEPSFSGLFHGYAPVDRGVDALADIAADGIKPGVGIAFALKRLDVAVATLVGLIHHHPCLTRFACPRGPPALSDSHCSPPGAMRHTLTIGQCCNITYVAGIADLESL